MASPCAHMPDQLLCVRMCWLAVGYCSYDCVAFVMAFEKAGKDRDSFISEDATGPMRAEGM